ncbi:MAG: restriction endonuclease [Nitrospira sp.]|nr:restriction endonuclease [Nitrospira sp.]
MNIPHHYPPELLNLLIKTIPLLFRSKKDVVTFFHGAGVSASHLADVREKVETAPATINKYEIVRQILVRMNDGCDATLQQRREVLKRVVEFEDFSTCWPNDQLKAKGLVAEIRRVIDVKDPFSRMKQEQEAERKKRMEAEKRKIDELNKKRTKLEKVKGDLYALFPEKNRQLRGSKLEGVLNRLFELHGILVREAFNRVGDAGKGVVEQIDGVISLDGDIYLVEMKWWDKPLGTDEVSQHLVRVFNRNCARGIFISYSQYTEPAITICKESLSKMIVSLCTLQEIVRLLEKEGDMKDFLRKKVQAAIIDKPLFYRLFRLSCGLDKDPALRNGNRSRS